VVEQNQLHGIIRRIEDSGIVVERPSGEEYRLPPDISALEPAEPGTYRFRSTAEEVGLQDNLDSGAA
jgi:hypothetical protein